MAKYLLQVSYNSGGWASQIANPQNRLEVMRPVIEKLGGSFESAYFSFGDYDIVAITDFPDNVSAAALSLAAAAGGAVSSIKTTPLLTIDEGIQALKLAGGSGYQPPSS